ncbi:MAG: hypothetical protein L6404_02225 [Candidatus Omnitrophica bacterium]|nr:hypothetical protein [Candidatus Omnitrophota bacterium]MCG2707456.1 hypothetical protein [Candidatus Omnitrophota bacterium]
MLQRRKMNKKFKKILKRIEQKPVDPLWFGLRQLENTKSLYEQNLNLPSNVRMANIQLVQNDIAAYKKRLKKRTRITQ